MKRAYEYNHEIITQAIPKILTEEEQTWEDAFDVEETNWGAVKLLWGSHVPGSYAPERVLLGGILSMYNMGYDVTEAEKLIPEAIRMREEEDRIGLSRLTAKVFHILNNAEKIDDHPYHSYTFYDTFEKYRNAVEFEKYTLPDTKAKEFYDRTYAGWTAQIVGAAVGTALEGYNTEKLLEFFGEINDYVRKPSTYNDDITYELAFLDAFFEKGYQVSSEDIAAEWVARIPSGWSAEDIALKNVMLGIFPPESGCRSNPFREWIGAQMRGAVCGMAAPGNPEMAASLAFRDGVVSHHNNGVIGEIFNAMMVSMAYAEKEMQTIVKKAIRMIPTDSEYYTVVKFALDQCEQFDHYLEAWKVCEKKFWQYNWIHAYPNAAIEVIALYYCENSLDRCINMMSMMGQDVDCNAAQVATMFGAAYGIEAISEKWLKPLPEELLTYVRGHEKTSIADITSFTVECVNRALENR